MVIMQDDGLLNWLTPCSNVVHSTILLLVIFGVSFLFYFFYLRGKVPKIANV